MSEILPARTLVLHLLAMALVIILGGCANRFTYAPAPEMASLRAQPVGFPGEPVRFWGDSPPEALSALLTEQTDQARERRTRLGGSGRLTLNYLALSGGGSDGAFGAGLLNGWTDHGSRPEFEIVTGISTGALIAPFAFLGSEWDEELRIAYTSITPERIFSLQIFSGLIGQSLGLLDTSPLRQSIAEFLTPAMFERIAEEHLKGRRLFVMTTHLESQRPVMWDIGRMAISANPGAIELARDVLLASASIPGAFPPVLFEVEAGGRRFQELHVDGGVTSQVSFLPGQINLEASRYNVEAVDYRLFVIRNGKVVPDYEPPEPAILSVVQRSISTLIKNAGIGDLVRIYLYCLRNGISFYLAAIPAEFTETFEEQFDPTYMAALFDYGYQLGRQGYPWRRAPPGFRPEPDGTAETTVLVPVAGAAANGQDGEDTPAGGAQGGAGDPDQPPAGVAVPVPPRLTPPGGAATPAPTAPLPTDPVATPAPTAVQGGPVAEAFGSGGTAHGAHGLGAARRHAPGVPLPGASVPDASVPGAGGRGAPEPGAPGPGAVPSRQPPLPQSG